MANTAEKSSNWSEVRNMKIRAGVDRRRKEGQRPRDIWYELAMEFGISESRVRQIYYRVRAK